MNRTQRVRLGAALAGIMWLPNPGSAALKLIESAPGFDFNVGQNPIQIEVLFSTSEPVHGVGISALWTAVIADNAGGTYPWSLDTAIEVTAPDGATVLSWPSVGGDRTIADFPLQDAAGGFAGVGGSGEFVWEFSQPSVPAPYTMGLRNVEYHLLTEVPDVVDSWPGTTAGGPLWDRPFFIGGISSLGPVSYHALQFEAAVPGLYSFSSVVNGNENFNFIYAGNFEPLLPLQNLFDYGLGNGNAPNGTPAGTSLIEALLLPGETYTYVTSQWSSSTPALAFDTTITGPGTLVAVCISCTLDDFNGDNLIDAIDQDFLLDGLSGPDNPPAPTVSGASAAQVLTAFDSDQDDDLDMADMLVFQQSANG
jgi:hypothetical protein